MHTHERVHARSHTHERARAQIHEQASTHDAVQADLAGPTRQPSAADGHIETSCALLHPSAPGRALRLGPIRCEQQRAQRIAISSPHGVCSASAAPRHRRAAADGLCVCLFASMCRRWFVCSFVSQAHCACDRHQPAQCAPRYPAYSRRPIPPPAKHPSLLCGTSRRASARRHNPIPLAMRCDSAGPSGASLSSVRRFDDGCCSGGGAHGRSDSGDVRPHAAAAGHSGRALAHAVYMQRFSAATACSPALAPMRCVEPAPMSCVPPERCCDGAWRALHGCVPGFHAEAHHGCRPSCCAVRIAFYPIGRGRGGALQPIIGGEAHALLLATISTAPSAYADTYACAGPAGSASGPERECAFLGNGLSRNGREWEQA
jgi:hypothetical protein